MSSPAELLTALFAACGAFLMPSATAAATAPAGPPAAAFVALPSAWLDDAVFPAGLLLPCGPLLVDDSD